MIGVCQRLRAVDISVALRELPQTTFADTGGTNGHLAYPPWLDAFVASLQLGSPVAHAVCRKLPAGQGIPPHVDVGPRQRRFHVPLVTHPLVTMRWPRQDVEEHLAAGFLYEVDFTQLHEIRHRAPVDRVHVQINVVDV